MLYLFNAKHRFGTTLLCEVARYDDVFDQTVVAKQEANLKCGIVK